MVAIDDLLLQLQVETAQAEAKVEAEIDILNPAFSLPHYIEILSSLYGFYRPLEERIANSGMTWYWSGWQPTTRSSWLEADLKYFDVNLQSIPLDTFSPASIHTADALGCQYALEHMTLGGPAAKSWLGSRLFLGEGGLRFFSGFGKGADAHLEQFREVLVAYSLNHPEACDQITVSAKLTYERLLYWLRQSLPSR